MMRARKIVPGFAVVFCVAIFLSPALAQQLAFTGQVVTSSSQTRRFSVKLYPPKDTGKPILITNTDAYGRFKFSGLSAASYLLEIYLGTDLVYQEVVDITKDTDRKIVLGKK